MRYLVRRLLFALGLRTSSVNVFYRALFLLTTMKAPVFFIQIGAHNGFSFDEFYAFAIAKGMHGLAIEPVESYYLDLQAAYRYYPDIRPLRLAIHPSETHLKIYHVADSKASHPAQHGMASAFRKKMDDAGVAPEDVVEEEVAALSFAKLCEDYVGGQEVDVLVVDTEGLDGEILRSVNFAHVRPRLIRIEQIHMSPRERHEIRELLKSNNYRIHNVGMDMVAVDPALDVFAKFFRAAMRADYGSIYW